MGKGGFRELKVWQKSKTLAVDIYRITDNGKLAKDFGLRDQMRRASVSVCSNIAEGDERSSDKDSVRFFYMAKGSLAELLTQIEIAYEIEFIASHVRQSLEKEGSDIARMLGALIRARGGY